MNYNLGPILRGLERSLLISTGLVVANTICTEGISGILRDFVLILRKLPFVNSVLASIISGEVKDAVKLLAGAKDGGKEGKSTLLPIPQDGVPAQEVIEIIKSLREKETSSEEGKAFAYTYTSSADMSELQTALTKAYTLFRDSSGHYDNAHDKLLDDCTNAFIHSNALNPMMYPSLRRFESEIVSMSAWLLNGDGETSGSVTSGGTESILMAVKSYRDYARSKKPHIVKPNMIVSKTIHPAFEKAAHYFGVDIIHVDTTADFRMDVAAAERCINNNTILLVGSAPQYCHGVIDPIEALSELAQRRGLPLHVDACFGGFMLPWIERIKQQQGIQPHALWDFRVKGVTSISADLHKYGYSSKGASVILYRNAELRSFQYFAYSEWPGGLFGSPSMAGSRPGGMLAAAWAALNSMGQNGYMELAGKIYQATQKLVTGFRNIEGLKVLGNPDMTSLAVASADPRINILVVADRVEALGKWKLERQQLPDSIHFSVLPQHTREGVAEKLLQDFACAVKEIRENKQSADKAVGGGSAGVYGMVAAIPDKGIVDDFVLKFFGALYSFSQPSILDEHRLQQQQHSMKR